MCAARSASRSLRQELLYLHQHTRMTGSSGTDGCLIMACWTLATSVTHVCAVYVKKSMVAKCLMLACRTFASSSAWQPQTEWGYWAAGRLQRCCGLCWQGLSAALCSAASAVVLFAISCGPLGGSWRMCLPKLRRYHGACSLQHCRSSHLQHGPQSLITVIVQQCSTPAVDSSLPHKAAQTRASGTFAHGFFWVHWLVVTLCFG